MKAVILFSGGQDSLVCLHEAINDGYEPTAIIIDYEQNHNKEMGAALHWCADNKIQFKVFRMNRLKDILESPLMINGDKTKLDKVDDNGVALAVVPNRNQIFLTLAHAYAQKIGATAIYAGMCQADAQAFPDCRESFLTALAAVTNAGAGTDIKFVFPVLNMTKARTLIRAKELHILEDVLYKTFSCYANKETPHEWGKGCGECLACQGRINGYNEFKEWSLR